MDATSVTLLDALKQPHAEAAWERFCRVYGPVVIRYGRKIGLSDADARDVLQESLIVLMRLLPGFSYDRSKGRFRNFLLTIVHRQALSHLRRACRRTFQSLDTLPPDTAPAQEGPAAEAADDRDVRWQEALLDDAWSRLARSGRLQPATLAVFEAYAIRGGNCEEVAKKHGMSANTVYQIRNRVLGILKSDVLQMLAEMDPEELEMLKENLS